jgi:methylated-DNA-protein-cysteine methyltransferase-like protein
VGTLRSGEGVVEGLRVPVEASVTKEAILITNTALAGKRRSDAYLRIWRTVTRIPRGRVASYGTVARLSGLPRQARVAGHALHQVPGGSEIPWYRVINAAGKISLPGKRGEEQERLLDGEGVIFSRGRVDMKRFEWKGGISKPGRK